MLVDSRACKVYDSLSRRHDADPVVEQAWRCLRRALHLPQSMQWESLAGPVQMVMSQGGSEHLSLLCGVYALKAVTDFLSSGNFQLYGLPDVRASANQVLPVVQHMAIHGLVGGWYECVRGSRPRTAPSTSPILLAALESPACFTTDPVCQVCTMGEVVVEPVSAAATRDTQAKHGAAVQQEEEEEKLQPHHIPKGGQLGVMLWVAESGIQKVYAGRLSGPKKGLVVWPDVGKLSLAGLSKHKMKFTSRTGNLYTLSADSIHKWQWHPLKAMTTPDWQAAIHDWWAFQVGNCQPKRHQHHWGGISMQGLMESIADGQVASTAAATGLLKKKGYNFLHSPWILGDDESVSEEG